MTPLQKLTRLAQIERQLLLIDVGRESEVRNRLLDEHEAIMRGIGSPPSELVSNPDPAAWVLALAETFEGITQEQAFPWLEMFAQAVYDKGRENGTKEAIHHINAGTQGLIDALRKLRGIANDIHMILPDIETEESTMSISEFITRTLRAAGLT